MLTKDKIHTLTAQETTDGQGVKIRRLFPSPSTKHFDPFVLLDEFFLRPPASFPDHEHRGFEAITYMLEGGFHHKDSLGNDTTVMAGGAQRFVAGKSLTHSEMPGTDQLNHGIQLWINLPRNLKQMPPEYQQIDEKKIPFSNDYDAMVRTVVGTNSPVAPHTRMTMLDVVLQHKHNFYFKIPHNYKGMAYLLSGTIKVFGTELHSGQAFLIDTDRDAEIEALGRSRFMLIAGKPHGEPIHLNGSFVD